MPVPWASTRASAARARSPPESEGYSRGGKAADVGLLHGCGHQPVVIVLGVRACPRRPTHAHDVADRERERDVDALEQHRPSHRQLPGAPVDERPAVDVNAPGRGCDVARDGPQQRRLAGTVRPHQRQQLAVPDIEVHLGQHRLATQLHREAPDLDRSPP